jgi:hypothetical protein
MKPEIPNLITIEFAAAAIDNPSFRLRLRERSRLGPLLDPFG